MSKGLLTVEDQKKSLHTPVKLFTPLINVVWLDCSVLLVKLPSKKLTPLYVLL